MMYDAVWGGYPQSDQNYQGFCEIGEVSAVTSVLLSGKALHIKHIAVVNSRG